MKTAVVLGEIAEKSADKKFLQPAIEPLITDEVIVTFSKGTEELKQTWQFRVTATGEVIRMED